MGRWIIEVMGGGGGGSVLEVKVKWRDVIGVDVARYSAGLANRLDRRW